MEITYTLCGEKHLSELVKIGKKTFVDAFASDNNPIDFKAYIAEAFSKDKLLLELQNPETFFYFVNLKDIRIGYFKINIGKAQTEIISEESIELERIYVLDEFQSLGFGELILKKVKQIGEARKKVFVWLGVWQKNVKAVQFYERHGFVNFGTHPYFIGSDKQTDWLMRIDLIKTGDTL